MPCLCLQHRKFSPENRESEGTSDINNTIITSTERVLCSVWLRALLCFSFAEPATHSSRGIGSSETRKIQERRTAGQNVRPFKIHRAR